MNPYNLEPQQMPVISIDFDGCIVEDKWPEIGEEIPGAVSTINGWYDAGYWIIINSCRTNLELHNMAHWLRDNGAQHHTINKNLVWRVCMFGTDPRKIGADVYIDDHNIDHCGAKVREVDWMIFKDNVHIITQKKERRLNANL